MSVSRLAVLLGAVTALLLAASVPLAAVQSADGRRDRPGATDDPFAVVGTLVASRQSLRRPPPRFRSVTKRGGGNDSCAEWRVGGVAVCGALFFVGVIVQFFLVGYGLFPMKHAWRSYRNTEESPAATVAA